MLVIKTLVDELWGEKLFLGFVDLRKAYDTVWSEGMLYEGHLESNAHSSI